MTRYDKTHTILLNTTLIFMSIIIGNTLQIVKYHNIIYHMPYTLFMMCVMIMQSMMKTEHRAGARQQSANSIQFKSSFCS